MDNMTFSFSIRETVKTAWGLTKNAKGAFWVVISIGIVLYVLGLLISSNKYHPAINMISVVLGIVVMILGWGLVYLGIQRAANLVIHYKMTRQVFKIGLFFRMIGLYLSLLALFIIGGGALASAIGYIFSLLLFGGLIILAIIAPDQVPRILPHHTVLESIKFSHSTVSTILFVSIAIGMFISIAWLMIHLLLRCYLVKAIVIAEKTGPWHAIKLSFRATKSHTWKLFCLLLFNCVMLILSLLPLGIGLIWFLPYVYINYGIVYRRLVGS